MHSAGHFVLSFPTVVVASFVLGPLAFNQFPRWSDFVIAGLLYFGAFSLNTDSLSAVFISAV
jgi:zinc transporter 5/7